MLHQGVVSFIGVLCSELLVEACLFVREQLFDRERVVDCQSNECFLGWIFYTWHSREVDYTEGHDISCPYGRTSAAFRKRTPRQKRGEIPRLRGRRSLRECKKKPAAPLGMTVTRLG